MKLLRSAIAVVSVMVSGFIVSTALADMPKEDIIAKAKKALESKNIVADECNIVYDEDNDAWEEWGELIARTPNDKNHGNLPKGSLENKKYQAIYFDFYDDAKKDIWVFVDPVSGEVLEIYEKK